MMKFKTLTALALALCLMLSACAVPGPDTPDTSVPETTMTPESTAQTQPEETTKPTVMGVEPQAGMWARDAEFTREPHLPDLMELRGDGELLFYGADGVIDTNGWWWYENGQVRLDTDSQSWTLVCREGVLYTPDDGKPAYYLLPDDSSAGEVELPDGRWYPGGAVNSDIFYEITGDQFQKLDLSSGEPQIMQEGTLTRKEQQLDMNGFQVEFTFYNPGAFGDVLIPAANNKIFITDNNEEYQIYVHFDHADDGMNAVYAQMERLLNTLPKAVQEDGTILQLNFTPYSFCVTPYEKDEAGELAPLGRPTYGTWAFTDSPEVELTFEDGTQETILIPQESGVLRIGTVDAEFSLQ